MVIISGNSFAMKKCTCLFRVGFSQAIKQALHYFPPEGVFSQSVQCSVCVCGLVRIVRLVLVFCLSHCKVHFCFSNVGFATCALGTLDDI